jgi:lysophospholipid acyltransferase (LPLAT)-like uncharacterized protein
MKNGDLRALTISGLGAPVLGALMRTARFSLTGEEVCAAVHDAGKPIIFALWHGRLLPLTWYHRHRGVATLISASRDGEYIARVVQRWGYTVVRGSSSRGGGKALREMVKLARSGQDLALTPDGPRGPREEVKPGVILAAQLSGGTLLPVSAGSDRAWWFEGWDRFLVPRPFARIRIAYGTPVHVPRSAPPEEVERIRLGVERELKQLTAEVDAVFR